MSITTGKTTRLKKVRKQGFRARMGTVNGRKVVNARRNKCRNKMADSGK